MHKYSVWGLFGTNFVFLSAEDGALLGKIDKLRVLRNDRREGKQTFIDLFDV